MLPYNSCNFNVGVQSFVICSKWGGNLIAGVYSVQEAGRYTCTKGGLQGEAGGRRVIRSQEAFGSPGADVCGLLLLQLHVGCCSPGVLQQKMALPHGILSGAVVVPDGRCPLGW